MNITFASLRIFTVKINSALGVLSISRPWCLMQENGVFRDSFKHGKKPRHVIGAFLNHHAFVSDTTSLVLWVATWFPKLETSIAGHARVLPYELWHFRSHRRRQHDRASRALLRGSSAAHRTTFANSQKPARMREPEIPLQMQHKWPSPHWRPHQ